MGEVCSLRPSLPGSPFFFRPLSCGHCRGRRRPIAPHASRPTPPGHMTITDDSAEKAVRFEVKFTPGTDFWAYPFLHLEDSLADVEQIRFDTRRSPAIRSGKSERLRHVRQRTAVLCHPPAEIGPVHADRHRRAGIGPESRRRAGYPHRHESARPGTDVLHPAISNS